MRPIPNLKAVVGAPGATLLVTWEDGRTDCVDLSGWLEAGHPAFRRLRDLALFATATLADDSTVEWGRDEYLAIDSVNLALLAEQQRAPGQQGELLA